ncbi:hypothetical protein [Streptomyces sp. NPDC049555]|uniref:hypothetical protein n=1 Tax=unclassified Streptomyces TaxID=2593676 RepID=UPI00341AA4FF
MSPNRLPWWAVVLPVVVFVALFCLPALRPPASAVSADGGRPAAGAGTVVVQVLRLARQVTGHPVP